MPWTVDNPPAVAKNWTADEKRKCVAAANAVLAKTGDDQQAIFACIHAAGKSEPGKKGANMEHKTFHCFTTKTDDAAGVVEQIVAVYGNVDMGLDRIQLGAFAKSIAERGLKVRVLDQHRTTSIMNVIGKPIAMKEVNRAELPTELLTRYPDATGGLWTKTQYLMDTPEGKGAFLRIAAGAVDEASIGYDALDVSYTKEAIDGQTATVRNLQTCRLWEYSPVIWGMNPATAVLSAKEMEGGTLSFEQIFESYLARLKTGEPMEQVLKDALAGTPDVKGAIPVHRPKMAPEDEAWSAPALKDYTAKAWGDLSDAEKNGIAKHYAFSANMPPETFGDLKLPHHRASDMAVVWNGVRNAASRLSQTQGITDMAGVHAHLAAHYKQFDKPMPWEGGKKAADFATLYAQRQVEQALNDQMWDMRRSLEDSMSSILSDETMTAEQKTAMVGDSLDQFKTCMMNYCQQIMSAMAQAQATGDTIGMMAQIFSGQTKTDDHPTTEAGPNPSPTLDTVSVLHTLDELEVNIELMLLEGI